MSGLNRPPPSAATDQKRSSPASLSRAERFKLRCDAAWLRQLEKLKSFKKKHGHCNVRSTDRNRSLAHWVIIQRNLWRANRLSPDRERLLEAAGFAFKPLENSWQTRLNELTDFKKKHGHCLGPWPSKNLRIFVQMVRQRRARGGLCAERIRQLDELGFVWDWRSCWKEHRWEAGMARLNAFRKRFGHIDVPSGTDQFLSSWVKMQRRKRIAGKLSARQIKRLSVLGFKWNSMAKIRSAYCAELIKFKKKHGHCAGPFEYNKKLKFWVQAIRQRKAKGQLSPQLVKQLDEIGFVWRRQAFCWDTGFNQLAAFKKTHGHCNVPAHSSPLGAWVARQRADKMKGKLAHERSERLEKLGLTWGVQSTTWEKAFAALKAFVKDNGHCEVPRTDRYLHSWCARQRQAKTKRQLTPDRVKRLQALGFSWNLRHQQAQGEKYLEQLRNFFQKHRHFAIPRKPAYQGLLTWIKTQLKPRVKREILELGFPLDEESMAWEQMFASAKSHVERHGHARLPKESAMYRWTQQQLLLAASGDLELDRERRLAELGLVSDHLQHGPLRRAAN